MESSLRSLSRLLSGPGVGRSRRCARAVIALSAGGALCLPDLHPAETAQESAPRVAEFEAVPGIPAFAGEGAVSDPAAVRADPVRLDLRLAPGRTYRYVGEVLLRGDLPGRGRRELRLEQQVRIDTAERAGARGGLALKVRSERLKLDLRSPGASLAFDSLSEEDRHSPVGRHFRGELFRWVELELNAENRVVESRDEGRISIDEADEGLAHLPSFGPDELRGFAKTLLQGLPDRAVAPGETWTVAGERRLEGAARYEFELAHRYLGEVPFEGRACHRIEFAGRLTGSAALPSVKSPEEPEDPGETPSRGALDPIDGPEGARIDVAASEIRGEILYDPELGLPREIRQTFRLVLEIPQGEVGTAGPRPEPLRVPVEQETRLSFLQTSATAP